MVFCVPITPLITSIFGNDNDGPANNKANADPFPNPGDWKTALLFDFVTYTDDPNVFPSDPEALEYLKSEVDNSHLYDAQLLGLSSLAKLGFTRFPTGINEIAQFDLYQNYPNPFTGSTHIK